MDFGELSRKREGKDNVPSIEKETEDFSDLERQGMWRVKDHYDKGDKVRYRNI